MAKHALYWKDLQDKPETGQYLLGGLILLGGLLEAVLFLALLAN